MKRIIIGISGASGVIYGIRLLEMLRPISGVETHLVMSSYARVNMKIETTYTIDYVESLADEVHKRSNQAASISSGSFKTDGMIIAPCSMKNPIGDCQLLQRQPDGSCRRCGVERTPQAGADAA